MVVRSDRAILPGSEIFITLQQICCFIRPWTGLFYRKQEKENSESSSKSLTYKNDKNVFGIFFYSLRKYIVVSNQESMQIATFNMF